MTMLVPHRHLFRFEIPLRRRSKPPTIDGDLRDWSDEFLVPPTGRLEGAEPFAPVYIAWDEAGLYVAFAVKGKRQPLRCDPKSFWKGDNFRLCTDMRDTRDIRRATQYCQQFYLLPTGGGKAATQPIGGAARIHRARAHAPAVPSERIAIAAKVTSSGYSLEAHIPADGLCGFDPADHRRIGLYYMLEDQDHGQQYLTVGDDLNWWIDPSTWATAVLVG
ncbi:MAG: hypothetical protein JXA69_00080 [Phycisphaerae bacterium]|nr:hypothetical protein [Phycisphaerae bacterium]